MDAKHYYHNYTSILDLANAADGTVIAFGVAGSNLANAEDRPPASCEYYYLILSEGVRKDVVAFGYNTSCIYMRKVWNRVWSGNWTQAATCACADMEWKPLPMINGWVNFNNDNAAALKYRKGADGKAVYVRGYIKLTGDLTAETRTFAYLPAGYRPTGFWWTTTSHEYNGDVLTCRINPDGRMYITATNSNVQETVNWALPICLTIPI